MERLFRFRPLAGLCFLEECRSAMQRDMDLVREILFQVERDNNDPLKSVEVEVEGYSDIQINYHIMLLAEAGLIEAKDASTLGGSEWTPKRLTWRGHEFLEAARSDTIWREAKHRTLQNAGGLSLDVLKAVLVQGAKHAVGVA
jgi:hypothetical protein